MVNTDILSIYYGGVIHFVEAVEVANSSGAGKIYQKGEEAHVTPAILHMIGVGKIPVESYRLCLRTLDQLEDEEVIELSRIVAPPPAKLNGKIFLGRTVSRQGSGKRYTVEVFLDRDELLERSMVINARYDMAISEVMRAPVANPFPVIAQLATVNQMEANRWLLQKHLDVFGLIAKGLAVGRESWGLDGYETPAHPRFKN